MFQYTSLLNTSSKSDFYTFQQLVFAPSPFTKILAKCHQATASDLPFYDIFAPQKDTFSKISDDVIACDLWFGPPQSKILATPMSTYTTYLIKLRMLPLRIISTTPIRNSITPQYHKYIALAFFKIYRYLCLSFEGVALHQVPISFQNSFKAFM